MLENTETPLGHSGLHASPEVALDQQLVHACLAGDEHAWGMLISRYRRLIYGHCYRYGVTGADASDVFQQVCAELFTALPRLRNQQSVRSWVGVVATHEAYRWKRGRLLRTLREGEEASLASEHVAPAPSTAFERTQREQAVRAAIGLLPPRCQQMLRLLFYEDPPAPYETVAGKLGLATGSIGIIRARCLKKLGRILNPEDACQ